jgi:hypothetical protein
LQLVLYALILFGSQGTWKKVIPAGHIVANEQMSKSGELLGPSQLFQQAAQADDSRGDGELGQGRRVGAQPCQPAEDVGIAVQLL